MKKKRTFFRNMLAIMIRSYRWRMNPNNIEAIITLEQQLWKFGFVCFITCFVLSCAPVKKLEKTEQTQIIATETNVQKNTEVKESGKTIDKSTSELDSSAQMYLERIEKLTAQYEARLRTYDTSKPIDPATGTPPIASDLIITNKTDNSKETNQGEVSQTKLFQNTDIEIDFKFQLQQRIDSLQNVNAKLISATETRETTLNNWWKWLLVGIFTPVLIFLIVRFKWYNILSFIWKKYN
jgi:hypothetical protein